MSVSASSTSNVMTARRPAYYANRVLRLAAMTALGQDFGPVEFALLTVVALAEDARRYRGPARFYNEQLQQQLGIAKWERLKRVRQTLIDLGWLIYEQQPHRRPGLYRVTIPKELADLPDSSVDESSSPESGYQEGDEQGDEAGVMRESSGGSNGGEEGEHSIPLPVPESFTNTTIPAEWLVVLDELKIFGCWDKTIPPAIETARQKGLTPQTVSALIRYAASKVIALDADGRPVSHWKMPSGDELETANMPHGRLYRWGPPILLSRIGNQQPHTPIGDSWPGKSDQTAAYDEAQRKLAAVPKVPRDDSEEAANRQAQADALRIERDKLEGLHGATIDALPLAEVIALLPTFQRQTYLKNQNDPRADRSSRLQVLRGFAARQTDADQRISQQQSGIDLSICTTPLTEVAT